MGHFGEIRLADPVFSAVVLPTKLLKSKMGLIMPSVYEV